MQRHFSSRGEALAEVTAARMLARRKHPGKSVGPRVTTNQWFSHRVEEIHRPKTKKPKRSGDVTTVL